MAETPPSAPPPPVDARRLGAYAAAFALFAAGAALAARSVAPPIDLGAGAADPRARAVVALLEDWHRASVRAIGAGIDLIGLAAAFALHRWGLPRRGVHPTPGWRETRLLLPVLGTVALATLYALV